MRGYFQCYCLLREKDEATKSLKYKIIIQRNVRSCIIDSININ